MPSICHLRIRKNETPELDLSGISGIVIEIETNSACYLHRSDG